MYCLVSKALEKINKYNGAITYDYPAYMYREKPDNESDSGWRFFQGYESNEYINNPDNIKLIDIDGFFQSYRDGYFNEARSPMPFIKDIPYGYLIDLRSTEFWSNGNPRSFKLIFNSDSYNWSSIGLTNLTIEQRKLPEAVFFGGYPDEWAIMFYKLSLEQRMSLTREDGTHIIQPLD